jgi:MFS family permease
MHKHYKWEVSILLWLAFFLNQADRHIYNVVLPLIRSDLQLTDAQMGTIASIFILTLGLLVPIAGVIGDLFSRKWICTITIIFWSGATMLTGLATLPLHLILFRSIATGGGEAFFAPANWALISQYHKKTRSLAMSIHQTSVYVGVVASGFIAAAVGEMWGWRAAFYVFGAAGVILGIVMAFRLKDAPIGQADSKAERVSVAIAIKSLFQKPTAVLLTVAFAGMIFVHVGYLTWMTTFLFEKFDMPLSKAGFTSVFFMNACAFIGVIISGKLTDKWAENRRRVRLEIQVAGMLLSAPFIVLMGLGSNPVMAFIGLSGFGFFRGLYDANIMASLYEVIEPKYRSSASGMMIMFAFIAGAVAPYLLGLLKPTLGLSMSFAFLSIVSVISGLAIWIALKFYFQKDMIQEE